MEASLNAPGFFGKLPFMGDFVNRGWDVGLLDKLDKLLQEALSELMTSSALGKDAVTQAPCMVLSLRPGLLGDQGLLIVVLPSHDRVGRTFPFCAGSQWVADGSDGMDWPSVDFAHALIATVQRCMDAEADPDQFLAGIAALGSPHGFRRTFQGLGGDETVPRLGAEVKLLCIRGPLLDMPPAQLALCSILSGSSDLLGIRFDATGGAQDFFVCRRLESGTALASLFDGRWIERGWSFFGSQPTSPGSNPALSSNFDEDATRPLQRAIDTATTAPDSR